LSHAAGAVIRWLARDARRPVDFTQSILEITEDESSPILDLLNKQVNSPNEEMQLLYNLEDIETILVHYQRNDQSFSEYLLISSDYYNQNKSISRFQRVMDLAKNAKFKIKIFDKENLAGNRINQFGGLILLTSIKKK
jgi:hypothetical protein